MALVYGGNPRGIAFPNSRFQEIIDYKLQSKVQREFYVYARGCVIVYAVDVRNIGL